MFATEASPWIAGLLALWYFLAIIWAELLRHYELTGRVSKPLRERKQIILRKPRETYFRTVTCGLFTWTIAVMHYRPAAGVIDLTVAALLAYMFVALWAGPMLTIVPTLDGVMIIMAAINCAVFLSIHTYTWDAIWWMIQLGTFIGVVTITVIEGVLLIMVVYWNNRAASRRQ